MSCKKQSINQIHDTLGSLSAVKEKEQTEEEKHLVEDAVPIGGSASEVGPEQEVWSRHVMSGCRGRKQFQVPARTKKPVSLGMKRGKEKGMEDEIRHPHNRFPGPCSQCAEANSTVKALESIGGFMVLEASTGFLVEQS